MRINDLKDDLAIRSERQRYEPT